MPAPVAAHVDDQRLAAHLGAQVTVQVRPALPHHVGHVQVADPAVGPRADELAAPGHPVLVAQPPLVAQRDDRPRGASPGLPRWAASASGGSVAVVGSLEAGGCRQPSRTSLGLPRESSGFPECVGSWSRSHRRRPRPRRPRRASAFGGGRGTRDGSAGRIVSSTGLPCGAGQRRPRAVHRVHRAAVDREDLVALPDGHPRRGERRAGARVGRLAWQHPLHQPAPVRGARATSAPSSAAGGRAAPTWRGNVPDGMT